MWGLAKGWSVIPKSVTPKRIDANFELDGWDLTEDEIKEIDAIPDRFKVCDGTFLPKNLPMEIFSGSDE